ncbi:hypothetical protein [Streptosporangium sandarakinum]|uniref:hypothetical protein n=1 Tax=Streptosporangium sandarakinum TaxID=1260955 RepID=UPI003679BD61
MSQSGDTGLASRNDHNRTSRSAPGKTLPKRRRRRAVCYEDRDLLPAVPVRTWFRLFRLLRVRGIITSFCAERIARHLTYSASKAGYITNLPKVIQAYENEHYVGERTFWKDLDRLTCLGLVRKVDAAAPSQPAKYVLCYDLARLPDDLPKSLARAVEDIADDPVKRAKKLPTLASMHGALAACVTVRYGSRTCLTPILFFGCGRVQTCLYIQEGPTPPPHRTPRERVQDDHGQSPWGNKTSTEEQSAAREVLDRCVASWRMQRASREQAEAEVPDAGALASVEHLVRLLLRYAPPSEAEEILSAQVGSVRDLAGVIRYRAGRWLRTLRRRHAIAVDDTGAGWARMSAELAQRRAEASRPESRRMAIDAARQALARKTPEAERWARADAAADAVLHIPRPAAAAVVNGPAMSEHAVDTRDLARRRAILRARAERARDTAILRYQRAAVS